MKKPTLAVGAGSHLALVWRRSLPSDVPVEFAPHEAIDRTDILKDRSVIINFCRHPDLDRRVIAAEELPEVRLAMQIANSTCHLIQMSSRQVYAPPQNGIVLSELSQLGPTTRNGVNKLAGEKAIAEILGARVTILRLANVFGLELQGGRRTFMGRLLAGLKKDRRLTFDVALSTGRDFLPDRSFARMLRRIVAAIWDRAGRPLSAISPPGRFRALATARSLAPATKSAMHSFSRLIVSRRGTARSAPPLK